MVQITPEAIKEELKTVIDPEVGLDIMTMGLVREVVVDKDNKVKIVHTLTTPMCPLGPQIQSDMRQAVGNLGIDDIEIELSFDPPWEPPADLRQMLGL